MYVEEGQGNVYVAPVPSSNKQNYIYSVLSVSKRQKGLDTSYRHILFLTFSLPHHGFLNSRRSITFVELKWNKMEAINISKSLRMNLAGGGTKLYVASDQMTILIYLKKFLEENDNYSLKSLNSY